MSDLDRKPLELEDENLQRKIDGVLAERDELYYSFEKARTQLETLENVVSELKSKIKFYEGQIEAYQYCMNCRR